MPDFNDLPKAVRQKIYKLHLTYDEPVDAVSHNRNVAYTYAKYAAGQHTFMPPLLAVSLSIEKEAAPYYYRDNVFITHRYAIDVTTFVQDSHMKMIQSVIVQWPDTNATGSFANLKRLKGLKELRIRVDELALVKKQLCRGKAVRFVTDDPSPQQQLAILQTPGLAGLMTLNKIKDVAFVKMIDGNGREYGGPIPGGVLETQIAPKLMGRKLKLPPKPRGKKGFRFLSLSAELRNHIYELHLRIPGTVQPSTAEPTSASKGASAYNKGNVPEPALCLLAVNRQIHDEAAGIFYHCNAFVFHYTLHLHGFMLSLGTERLSAVRDVSVHYHELVSGGMSLTDMTFNQLHRLTGLRRLEIILRGDLSRKIVRQRYGGGSYSIKSANPAQMPGMRRLFDLRNVTDIKVRDEQLEDQVRAAKEKKKYPKFGAGTENGRVVTVDKILQHFNAALAQAQLGNVKYKILDDEKWHLAKVFPSLDVEESEVEYSDDEGSEYEE
ncbi:hypothetical protein LTR22_009684 [Elasticomyces elasticus]|nr:hypothetical protein LTR22_009684 [Elasticomyces elasticus]KAK4921577.1 hypothetical protein LTR49_011047 [Elasticomyces elasticus]KAK5760265.1 hypothetical protein LTS12_009649 [Elasticomyces elasticus]